MILFIYGFRLQESTDEMAIIQIHIKIKPLSQKAL
jgi:hypothetical protein